MHMAICILVSYLYTELFFDEVISGAFLRNYFYGLDVNFLPVVYDVVNSFQVDMGLFTLLLFPACVFVLPYPSLKNKTKPSFFP